MNFKQGFIKLFRPKKIMNSSVKCLPDILSGMSRGIFFSERSMKRCNPKEGGLVHEKKNDKEMGNINLCGVD